MSHRGSGTIPEFAPREWVAHLRPLPRTYRFADGPLLIGGLMLPLTSKPSAGIQHGGCSERARLKDDFSVSPESAPFEVLAATSLFVLTYWWGQYAVSNTSPRYVTPASQNLLSITNGDQWKSSLDFAHTLSWVDWATHVVMAYKGTSLVSRGGCQKGALSKIIELESCEVLTLCRRTKIPQNTRG